MLQRTPEQKTHPSFVSVRQQHNVGLHYTGWAKKTGLFLEVCDSRIC